MLNAQYGLQMTAEDVTKLGQQVLRTEREFNRLAGFTGADDSLPEFFVLEEFPPHNTRFDIDAKELSQVFNF